MDKGVYVILQLISIFMQYLTSLLNLNNGMFPTSCPLPSDEPLLLSPFILSNQTQHARELSRVRAACLQDFVPPSHSGFITVNESLGNHLFFWYFPSPTNLSAPLLLWLNGGPGISSMQGLLYQNGPLKIQNDGQGWSYSQRNHSFVGSFSMLYVDNPVGVGYSFSDEGADSYRLSQEEYGEDLLEFMNQFVELFPQYQSDNDVYIGGQSYAGKYVPVLGYYIHSESMRGVSKINFKGIYLAGPLFDPETNFEYIHDYYYSMGVISHQMLLDFKRLARDDFESYNSGALVNDSMQRITFTVTAFKLPTNVYNFVTGANHDAGALDHLMNSWQFRSALHIGSNLSYSSENNAYFNEMYKDVRRSSKDKLAVLMDNYKVMIYNGDYDVITNTNTIEAGLFATEWQGQTDYEIAYRKPWVYGGKIRGYYSSVGQFCRVIVHGAGHQIGLDQEESNLVLLEQFVRHGCVS